MSKRDSTARGAAVDSEPRAVPGPPPTLPAGIDPASIRPCPVATPRREPGIRPTDPPEGCSPPRTFVVELAGVVYGVTVDEWDAARGIGLASIAAGYRKRKGAR